MKDDDRNYRELIDELVQQCKEGQGQIAARRTRRSSAKSLRTCSRINFTFDRAYERTPFNDFVGRLTDWNWPEDGERS